MILDDGKYTERQKRCIPDVSFELIPIKNLVSSQEYQRAISMSHVKKAASRFDLNQINPVKVSRRDGINYVFNGQHTIEIVALVSGSRHTPVWCMVYENLEYMKEAHTKLVLIIENMKERMILDLQKRTLRILLHLV